MGFILKGIIYGLLLIVLFTFVLAPKISVLSESEECKYLCNVADFSSFYLTSWGILFILINLFLGIKISSLSYLVSGRGTELIKESKKSYTWLWDHKLTLVEDNQLSKD